MNLHIYWSVCVLNILGSRAAPYIDAYINADGTGYNPGVEMNPGTPGTEFEIGNWTGDYNLTSDYDGDDSLPPEFLYKVPGHTTNLTVDKIMDLFLFMPDDEDVCYIKDMADFEEYGSQKYMVTKPNECNNTNDDPIPERINLSLPEKCRPLPVKWLDEFYCDNNLDLDDPDIIKALRPFQGPKRFCSYKSKTVHTQKCYTWNKGNKLVTKKTLVCLRSIQINSHLKCKKEVTNYQSDKEYFVTEEQR
ncbi:uncharacterized protein LOC117341162 [Pecten maximus]|uniref:uncharacterized protein LOC117341162 n=1 Tax=Pecten maximus TaxID=6579 RepID=UPI001458E71D|nr:uncharacterized protein LOC117341162 [Pecten maximus]